MVHCLVLSLCCFRFRKKWCLHNFCSMKDWMMKEIVQRNVFKIIALLNNFILAAFKIKMLLVPVNWSLWQRSRRPSYLPRRSQDCLLSLTKMNYNCGMLNSGDWKTSAVKTLQIRLYSVFLNVPIKHVQENEKKKFDCKRKRTFFISTSLQSQHWTNKDNDFLWQLSFLSLYLL